MEFKLKCARRVEHLDKSGSAKKCLDVVEKFIKGEASIEDLRTANDAARDAAYDAARDAAYAAADAAADAAYAADAARDAAYDAARDAAYAAEREYQTEIFREIFS